MNIELDMDQLPDGVLDAAVDECEAKIESPSALDPLTILAIARTLVSLYREMRRRGR